jgi:hypothetical protein
MRIFGIFLLLLIFFGLGDARDRDVVAVGAAAESSNSNKQVIEVIQEALFGSISDERGNENEFGASVRKNERRYSVRPSSVRKHSSRAVFITVAFEPGSFYNGNLRAGQFL